MPDDTTDLRGRSLVDLLRRITRLEVAVAAASALVLAVLVVLEPDILEAPFASTRAILFTVGGTAMAAIALLLMLRGRVPAPVRVVVLGLPFVAVNWWLVSPFFVDDVVDDSFEVSIADAALPTDPDPAPTAPASSEAAAPDPASSTAPPTTAPPPPAQPVLLGSGQFVGLAGHEGTGDAGLFAQPDGGLVLRFENFDIENGPDLRVYLVPGADRTDLAPGSIDLGGLRGNVGDQNYELPAGADVAPGPWTALVWCEAFTVEFVAASMVVAAA